MNKKLIIIIGTVICITTAISTVFINKPSTTLSAIETTAVAEGKIVIKDAEKTKNTIRVESNVYQISFPDVMASDYAVNEPIQIFFPDTSDKDLILETLYLDTLFITNNYVKGSNEHYPRLQIDASRIHFIRNVQNYYELDEFVEKNIKKLLVGDFSNIVEFHNYLDNKILESGQNQVTEANTKAIEEYKTSLDLYSTI